MNMLNKFFLICLIIFLSSNAFALTTAGRLKDDEVWQGEIELTGDVDVPEGVVLKIKPGARIRFTPRASSYDISIMEKCCRIPII